jgi:salicylate hydroxylase
MERVNVSKIILIAGGGIGGLTLALALLRQGIKVQIFEKASSIGDVGAGISLGTTATKGLYSLGLQSALSAVSDRPSGSSAALHYQTGEPLEGGFKDRKWKSEDLDFTHMIHRADLFSILQKAICDLDPDALRLGYELEGFDQDDDGVTARFDNGRTAYGNALIGCDGIRSTVRARMFGEANPRFTGQVVYRFLVPMEKALPFMTASIVGPYVGPGKVLTRYPIRKATLVNCAAFVSTDSWTGEGWAQRCSVEELQALFTGWHSDVLGLAANAPLDGTAKWALYDRDPLDIWVQGRVALLGDAAHPMLPFLGLGAAMGIEDAVVLGRAFSQIGDTRDALSIYQASRSARAGLMLLESRRQGELFRDGPGGTTQRTITTHSERMAYDPSTVAL